MDSRLMEVYAGTTCTSEKMKRYPRVLAESCLVANWPELVSSLRDIVQFQKISISTQWKVIRNS